MRARWFLILWLSNGGERSMYHVEWTDRAYLDIQRLYEFQLVCDPGSVGNIIDALLLAPERLIEHPRIGEAIKDWPGREVRRLLVGRYELRYDIVGHKIRILRLFHARENRSKFHKIDGDV